MVGNVYFGEEAKEIGRVVSYLRGIFFCTFKGIVLFFVRLSKETLTESVSIMSNHCTAFCFFVIRDVEAVLFFCGVGQR